jgi:hypothetical protein
MDEGIRIARDVVEALREVQGVGVHLMAPGGKPRRRRASSTRQTSLPFQDSVPGGSTTVRPDASPLPERLAAGRTLGRGSYDLGDGI